MKYFKKIQNSHRRCSVRNGVLRNFAKFTGKHLCQSLYFNKVACNFIKIETLAQVFSCEFCDIFKNAFFTEHLQANASKNKTFEESSKSRGVFTTRVSIYDGAFQWIYLTACYFCSKSSIIDVRLGYIKASEVFKMMLS